MENHFYSTTLLLWLKLLHYKEKVEKKDFGTKQFNSYRKSLVGLVLLHMQQCFKKHGEKEEIIKNWKWNDWKLVTCYYKCVCI